MIKLLSGVCFSVSLGMYFVKKANLINSKGYFLNDMINFIAFVKDSVRYTRTDILTIKKVSTKKFSNLKFLTKGINNNCFGFEKDVDLFMQGIGKTDIVGQMELCERYFEFFKNTYEIEKKKIEQSVKSYCALGLFSAAALLVVFI